MTSVDSDSGGEEFKADATEISSSDKVISDLIAGAAAGASAKSTIAPFDRTKINFQITNKAYSLKEAFYFLAQSYKTSGVLSLWRGNSATMARVIPYGAVKFATFEQAKHFLHLETLEEKKKNPIKLFIAGSLAGIVSTTSCYPLDLARTRMAVTHKEMYSSLTQVLAVTWKTEGIANLYRGLTPALLGIIPYAGTSFFTNDTLKRLHSERTDNRPLHWSEILIFGALSGAFGQFASYPFDIVRRRMQTAALTGCEYRTIRSTMTKIIKQEGFFKGLYKGLSLNWIKGPIASGISFTAYELTQTFIKT